MITYLIPILIYLVSKGSNTKINLTSISIFLILALRENIGYDYENYTKYYNNLYDNYELISRYITKFTFIFEDYHFFFLTYAFLTIFFLRKAAQIRNNHFLIILFVLMPGFFIDSFTTVRQALAISIVIYAYAIKLNMNKYYYIPLLLSCLIHYSAIPFVLSFIFINFFSNKKFLPVIIISLVITFYYFALQLKNYLLIFFPKINFYSTDSDFGGLLFLFYLLVFFVLFRELLKTNWSGFNLVLLGLILYIPFQQLGSVFLRINTYFFIPFLFSQWNLPFLHIKKNSLIWLIPLIVVYILILYIKTYDFNQYGSMIPYKTFINL